MSPATARMVLWVILLLLGGAQSWVARYTTTPDGISYLDLSDAIVSGNLGQLVNAYWSPLYPALLGLLRLIVRQDRYWETAVQHLLNVFLFAGSIAAFEYFLRALTAAASSWGRAELGTIWGTVAAYAVFGAFSLMMTPLTLPTPDLIVSTASFLAFGALLRLTHGGAWHRAAIVLGIALAFGSVAKSFVIPWSVVCLLVAWRATRFRWGGRPAAAAAAIWLAVVLPWCAGLSFAVGRATIGEAGRLTYVWYVNGIESPSAVVMPHAATSPATDSILSGVAITPNATGTNPIWYDPARWYSGLSPRFEPGKQLQVFSFLVGSNLTSLAPIAMFLWFVYAVAGANGRRSWWGRSWVVVVPCLVAIGAYSLILTALRYVAPFYVAIVLATWAGMSWPRRIAPRRILLAIGVPFLVLIAMRAATTALAYESVAMGSVLFVWALRRRGPVAMVVSGIVGALLLRLLVPPSLRITVTLDAMLIVACYWLASRQAIASHEGLHFSQVFRRGVLIANAAFLVAATVLKYATSISAPEANPREPNSSWIAASALRGAGIEPGERIAIVGSPFAADWARTAQLQIVGVVPPSRISAYVALAEDKRDRLSRAFADAGATHLIVQTNRRPASGDSSWIAVPRVGWVKRIARP